MKTTAIVLAATIICFAAAQQVEASGVIGKIHISTRLQANQVQAAKDSVARLGSVKLKGSNIGSTLNVNNRVVIGGPANLKRGAHVRMASLDLGNARIGGTTNLQMNVNVHKGVYTGRDSEIGLGGVEITADSSAGEEVNSQSLNRLVSGLNTPVSYKDITGYKAGDQSTDIYNNLLVEIDEIEHQWRKGMVTVSADLLSHATEWKIIKVTSNKGKVFYRKVPHVGTAGKLAKGLEKGLQYKIVYDLVKNGVKEYKRLGYTGADLKDSIINIDKNIWFAAKNPDALLQAAEDSLTSTTAVVLNTLTLDLFDITGNKVRTASEWYVDTVNNWFNVIPFSKSNLSQPMVLLTKNEPINFS